MTITNSPGDIFIIRIMTTNVLVMSNKKRQQLWWLFSRVVLVSTVIINRFNQPSIMIGTSRQIQTASKKPHSMSFYVILDIFKISNKILFYRISFFFVYHFGFLRELRFSQLVDCAPHHYKNQRIANTCFGSGVAMNKRHKI